MDADNKPLAFLSGFMKLHQLGMKVRELTAAILPEAEMAPTVRLESRSAFLKDMIPAREAMERLFE